jgi:hypothetical protein
MSIEPRVWLVHAFNSGTQEVEVGGWKFKLSLGNIAKSCLKKEKNN